MDLVYTFRELPKVYERWAKCRNTCEKCKWIPLAMNLSAVF